MQTTDIETDKMSARWALKLTNKANIAPLMICYKITNALVALYRQE